MRFLGGIKVKDLIMEVEHFIFITHACNNNEISFVVPEKIHAVKAMKNQAKTWSQVGIMKRWHKKIKLMLCKG